MDGESPAGGNGELEEAEASDDRDTGEPQRNNMQNDLYLHQYSNPRGNESNSIISMVIGAFSPGAESNPDSCYDSDASSVGSRRSSLRCDSHSEISRTVSDTLANEDPESQNRKVNILSAASLPQHIPITNSPSYNETQSSSGSDSPPELMTNTAYASKVEFCLRLGYNEEQIQSVIDKVGYKVSEDHILNELIQLGEDSSFHEDISETLNHKLDKVSITSQADVSFDDDDDNLRPIVIDGSNIAMSHAGKDIFSCMGIKLAVDWFKERGHKEITVFVPQWRKETSRQDTPIFDQNVLLELENEGIVVFTPSRRVGGKRVICYDDRYTLKLAAENGGIVVSNDHYRDLVDENSEFKKVVEERLLMYSFVNDRFMPPDDPLGRYGPTLDDFLKKHQKVAKNLPPVCPYSKKCTYGNKCKYYHPERGQQPVKLITDRIVEKAIKAIREVKEKGHLGSGEKKKLKTDQPQKIALTRSKTQTPVPPMPPKQTLARTQSLHPGLQSRSPIPLLEFMKPNDTKKKESGVIVSVIPDSDSEEYHRYNNKLSELRKKIEEADENNKISSDVNDTKEKKPASKQFNHLDPQSRVKKMHWSQMHTTLCPVNSDPPMSFTGGSHLTVAKKLSDEGRSEGLLLARGLSPVTPLIDQSTNKQEQTIPMRKHRALDRQLSLKGSDDPRLNRYSSDSTNNPALLSHLDYEWTLKRQGLNHSQSMSFVQVAQAFPNWPQSEATNQHSLLEKHVSCPISSSCNSDQSKVHTSHPWEYSHWAASGSNLNPSIPKHVEADKHPVQRLRSDPVNHTRGQQDQQMKLPHLNRQNSSSDPQLNAYHENHVSRILQISESSNIGTYPPDELSNTNSAYGHQNIEYTMRGSGKVVKAQQPQFNPNTQVVHSSGSYSQLPASSAYSTIERRSSLTGMNPHSYLDGMQHVAQSQRLFVPVQFESPHDFNQRVDSLKLFSPPSHDLSRPPPPVNNFSQFPAFQMNQPAMHFTQAGSMGTPIFTSTYSSTGVVDQARLTRNAMGPGQLEHQDGSSGHNQIPGHGFNYKHVQGYGLGPGQFFPQGSNQKQAHLLSQGQVLSQGQLLSHGQISQDEGHNQNQVHVISQSHNPLRNPQMFQGHDKSMLFLTNEPNNQNSQFAVNRSQHHAVQPEWNIEINSSIQEQGSRQNLPSPADARNKVYYHLCALFPNDIVTRVMNDNPLLADPQELCKLIITMQNQ